MNDSAQAYLRQHRVVPAIDGHSELALPLDNLQQFLDLLGSIDVPDEKLQDLYRYQAALVAHIQAHAHSAGSRDMEQAWWATRSVSVTMDYATPKAASGSLVGDHYAVPSLRPAT